MTAIAPAPKEFPALAWLTGFTVIAVAAALVPPLSIPAVALILIGGLSLPRDVTGRPRNAIRLSIAVATLGSVIGLARFAVSNVMVGITESGESATAFSSLWRLREVVIAEDDVRRGAQWDPDGDHIGSASLISGLIGAAPIRGTVRVTAPLLNYAFHTPVETPRGEALHSEGYLFIVCLPTPSGGWTARAGDPVDDERAERRFVAYAWPSDIAKDMNTIFFADEHERLLVLDPPRGAPAPYLGASHPPACDAALGGDGAKWAPWKNKQPRKTLPGDLAAN